MQHYQVLSAEYNSCINHVISLGLAEDYIAQLHGSWLSSWLKQRPQLGIPSWKFGVCELRSLLHRHW